MALMFGIEGWGFDRSIVCRETREGSGARTTEGVDGTDTVALVFTPRFRLPYSASRLLSLLDPHEQLFNFDVVDTFIEVSFSEECVKGF